MTTFWLAEHKHCRNWYAGTLRGHPITSLVSQARKTTDRAKCEKWCEANPAYAPKQIEMDDELETHTD